MSSRPKFTRSSFNFNIFPQNFLFFGYFAVNKQYFTSLIKCIVHVILILNMLYKLTALLQHPEMKNQFVLYDQVQFFTTFTFSHKNTKSCLKTFLEHERTSKNIFSLIFQESILGFWRWNERKNVQKCFSSVHSWNDTKTNEISWKLQLLDRNFNFLEVCRNSRTAVVSCECVKNWFSKRRCTRCSLRYAEKKSIFQHFHTFQNVETVFEGDIHKLINWFFCKKNHGWFFFHLKKSELWFSCVCRKKKSQPWSRIFENFPEFSRICQEFSGICV